MLQFETVPASLAALLLVFRPCLTAPSFATFGALVAGMVAQPGRRTVCGMLVRPKQATSKQAIAAELVTAVAAAHPGRQIHVVADAWYAGSAGAQGAARGTTRARVWPERATLTSRLRVNAVLNAIATPVASKGGRPRRIGAKLGTPKDLAATATWAPATVRRY